MRKATVLLAMLLLVPATAEANQPPVADAGEDHFIYWGESAELCGSATDPDGDAIVSWAWAIDSAPEGSIAWLYPPTYPYPVFSPDLEGDYVLSLVVSDGTDDSLPDTVIVHVTLNLPPTAVLVADVTTGEVPLEVHFDGTQSFDPEGGPLTYFLHFDDPLSDDPCSWEATATHTYQWVGVYLARLYVKDDLNQPGGNYVLIEVTERVNDPPVAVALVEGQEAVTVPEASWSGTGVTLDGGGSSDPDADPLTYAWDFTSDGSVDSTDAMVQVTYPLGGPYTATLTVADPDGETSTDTVSISVVPGVPENQLSNLGQFIQDHVASGHVEPELETSLLAKVEAALDALAGDNKNAAKVAMNDLKALVNQVEAQVDKKIDLEVAAEIIERANRIIADLGG